MALAKKKKINYKKELDKYFSRYIRLRDSVDGKNQCVTCKRVYEIKSMDCGHYVSRTYLNTRFDEQNCHPQCKSCNVFKNGNMDEYALYLIGKYGDNILEELNDRKNQSIKISAAEYREKIEHYKTLIEQYDKIF